MPSSKFTRSIFFKRITIDARVGILEHELRATQPICIDLHATTSVSQTVNDNDIHSVLDYRLLRECIIAECTRTHIHLIETLAEQIAQKLLDDFPSIVQLTLRVSKPMAFSDCQAVGIEVQAAR